MPLAAGRDLIERQTADDERDGLVAGVAADAGDDRHQRRERDEMLDRALEGADHARRDESRRQIDRQPGPAVGRRVPDRREQVLRLAQARERQHVVRRRGADEVHHGVGGDAADQLAAVVDDRRRQQVVALEGGRDLGRVIVGMKSPDVGIHDRGEGSVARRDKERAEADRADEDVARVDDEQPIRVRRQWPRR